MTRTLSGVALTLLYLFAAHTSAADEPLLSRGQSLPSDEELLLRSGPVDTRSVNHVLGGWLETGFAPADRARFTRSNLDLSHLTDGSSVTGIALSASGRQTLTTVFAGAAEWTNLLEVTLVGDATLAVDVLMPDGTYQDTGAVIPAGNASPFDARTEIVDLKSRQVQGLRLRLVAGTTAELKEVGAYWNEPILAYDAVEIANEYAEDYPGTGNDLSSPDLTVKRMSNYLDDRGWNYLFSWGDQSCWEQDYKRVDLGGTNQSWIDATDMFIHCSHGTDDQLFLANSSNDDASVTAADINGAWGNGDLEWAWIHCCLNMKTLAWHNALAGAHTISGWQNVINSSANWGKNIAQHLYDDGIFDAPRTIVQSWWSSNSSNQPSGNIARLLAEDNVHYNEYIWGQGPVQSDSNDSQHWWWQQNIGAKSLASPQADLFMARSQPRSDEPILWEAPPSMGSAGAGMKVFVHPSALADFQARKVEAVGQYAVLPSGMGTDLAAERLRTLCELLGDDCPTLEVGREGETAVVAGAGFKTLTGALASGAIQFADSEAFQIPTQRPEFAIDPESATQEALQIMGTLRFGDQQWIPIEARTNVIQLVEGEGPDPRVVDEYPVSVEVVLGQLSDGQVEQLPLLGPGGRAHLMFGPQGELQGLNMTSRQLQLREVVPPEPIEEVLNQLAAFGYNVVDTAPEFPAGEVTVRNISLAYLERGAYDEQPVVGPVYALDVEMVSTDLQGLATTTTGQLWIAADTPALQGNILEPQDGDSFVYGEDKRFVGEAVGGTGPYSFEWTSSTNGLLGTGPILTTNQLVAFVKGAGNVTPVTVELKVTDSNGNVATQVISLVQAQATDVDGTPRAGSRLLLASPNPFNPRTVLAFDLDRKADVSMQVYDVRGRLVRTLIDGESLIAGRHSRVWDGTDASGRPVAAGVYLYRVAASVGGDVIFGAEQKVTLVK